MRFIFEARYETDGGGWHADCVSVSLGVILTNTTDRRKLPEMVKDAIETALHAAGVSGPYTFHIVYK